MVSEISERFLVCQKLREFFNKTLLTPSHGAGVHVEKGYFDKHEIVPSLQEFVVEGGDQRGKAKITTASRQAVPHPLEPIFHTASKYCFKTNTGLNRLPVWSPCMAPLHPQEKNATGLWKASSRPALLNARAPSYRGVLSGLPASAASQLAQPGSDW